MKHRGDPSASPRKVNEQCKGAASDIAYWMLRSSLLTSGVTARQILNAPISQVDVCDRLLLLVFPFQSASVFFQTSDETMLNPEPNYQVLSQIRDGPNLYLRQYKKRKTHTKTRSGCLTCRARKVKVSIRIPHDMCKLTPNSATRLVQCVLSVNRMLDHARTAQQWFI